VRLFNNTEASELESRLYGSMVDRRRDAIYDRIRLRAGHRAPSKMRFFRIPVGIESDWTETKTYADTNMVVSGMLPPPHDAVVQRFLLLFQPSSSEVDRNALVANYAWEFGLLQKVMQRQPALVAAAVGEPEMVLENFGKGSWMNSPEQASTSRPEVLGWQCWWDLKNSPIYIPPLAPFRVELTGEPFTIQNDLDGTRDYPVQ
jgi:hypothetical protein